MNAPARRASSSAKRVNMPTEPVALCWWWWSRKYEKNLTSSVSMADRTEASLRLHIVPWLERLQLASIADLTRHALATKGRGWHENWYKATVKSGESYIEGLEASDLRLLDETMTRHHRQLSASGQGQKPASQ